MKLIKKFNKSYKLVFIIFYKIVEIIKLNLMKNLIY